MQEAGLQKTVLEPGDMFERLSGEISTSNDGNIIDDDLNPFQIQDVQLSFFLVLFGFTLALIAFAAENCHEIYQQ